MQIIYRHSTLYTPSEITSYPRETAHRLEQCYRELGDFKRAYEYACRQR